MDDHKLNGQLNLILDRVERNRADLKDIKKDMATSAGVEELRGQFVMSSTDHEHRLREVERHSATTSERWRVVNMAQVAWATIAAAMAAWIGSKR